MTKKTFFSFASLALFLFWHSLCLAGTGDLFAEPAFAFEVPEPLLKAISFVESGFNPWVLNVGGKTLRFKSREDALAVARDSLLAGKSFDLGLMQVNSWWLRKFGVSPEAAIEPLANIYFGAYILSEEYRRLGNVFDAVGSYHSPKKAKADAYARTVLSALDRGLAESRLPRSDKSSKKIEAKPPSPEKEPESPAPEKPRPDPGSSPMLIQGPRATLAREDTMLVMAVSLPGSMKVYRNTEGKKK
jgi:hypothetical protein